MLPAPRREPRWIRLRRTLAMTIAGVLVLAGAASITGQILTWLAPPSRAAAPVSVTDRDFDAVAVPFAVDYLSWDQDGREARQVALARSAAPDTTVDGWTGAGRQWADSPTAVGIARAGRDRAVVTVRTRVIPFTEPDATPSPPAPSESAPTTTPTPAPGNTPERAPGTAPGTTPDREPDASQEDRAYPSPPAPTPSPNPSGSSAPNEAPNQTPDGVPNIASGPTPGEPGEGGWIAGAPRWLNVAVPVARLGDRVGGRVVVTAPPVLVGSPQPSADAPAVPGTSSAEDAGFARDTRRVITTLIRAYGTGELAYARAPSTSFTGLNQAASVKAVPTWRVRKPDGATGGTGGAGDGAGDGSARVGDVTVTWSLSGGAGEISCTYRVELRKDSGRWYLASIGAATGAVS